MEENKRSRQFPSSIGTTQFVRLYILHLLIERSHYGKELIDEIGMRLGGNWKPSPGMVYPMLFRLESEGYIYGSWTEPEKRAIKRYRITKEGEKYYRKSKLQLEPMFNQAANLIDLALKDLYKKRRRY